MLSNTATPKYYGEFRAAVLRGEIPVCKEIVMQMNRIDAKIANPGIYYDDLAVEGFIAYCENELTLADGSDLKLMPSFKLWAEDIFGWYYFKEGRVYDPTIGGYKKQLIKKRLTTRQYLIVARGAAKSMYASMIQSFFLNVNNQATSQVTTAPTMEQADEIMAPIRTSIVRHRGPLFSMLTLGSANNTTGDRTMQPKLLSTKKGIENKMNGSILKVRPMDIESLQGLKIKVATVDEWLSCDIKENVIDTLEQGCAKNGDDDFLVLATSSEGTVRDGVGDDIKMMLLKILRGEYINWHISIFYYRLDDVMEVGRPEMWLKANPNLDITVTYETYQNDVDRMESDPSMKNDLMAKRFGIPSHGYDYFFVQQEIIPHRKCDCWRMPCSMGADMSQGDDFCAFTFLFPLPGDRFGVKTRSYITQLTYDRLMPVLREKYKEFINEGTLIIMEGTVLDMMEVYDDLDEFINEHEFDIRSFGFDPYNAREFVERWARENGPYGIEKVPQGVKTESVPLGEIKKLASERLLIFDQELMSFTMGNAVVLEDNNGNRKLMKKRREEKIDNVAALLDAYVAYKLHKEDFE